MHRELQTSHSRHQAALRHAGRVEAPFRPQSQTMKWPYCLDTLNGGIACSSQIRCVSWRLSVKAQRHFITFSRVRDRRVTSAA